jgi:hypothetical protein
MLWIRINHDIKMPVCLDPAPNKHTVHKTLRAPCVAHGREFTRALHPLPVQDSAFYGLLNGYFIAVDFTSYRGIGRFFFFAIHLIRCSRKRIYGLSGYFWLSPWQCYIAKYP